MWALRHIHRLNNKGILYSNIRTFLSEAFECNKTWENRINSSIFQKLNVETLYYELESEFNKHKKISPIDVDLFVNSLKDDTYITEAEELVHKLRLTGETHKTLPTTSYAMIRLFISSGKYEDIVRILHDRLNYGIFPDDYSLIYLINKFIKMNDIRNAAKVASLPMFQEEYKHQLLKYISLYSLNNYVNQKDNLPLWEEVQQEEEDDGEEVKVRVGYLRNEFFDDHFDLKDPEHICGKAMVIIGSSLPGEMGSSYRLLGLALYNKWEKLRKFIQQIQKEIIYEEIVSFVKKIVNDKCTEENVKNEILKLVDGLKTVDKIPLEEVKSKINAYISNHEQEDIVKQENRFLEMEKIREEELHRQLLELQRRNRLQAVKEKKEELAKKEEHLYYFDNEDEIEVMVEEKIKRLQKLSFGRPDIDIGEIYEAPETKPKGYSRRD